MSGILPSKVFAFMIPLLPPSSRLVKKNVYRVEFLLTEITQKQRLILS